MTAGRAAAALLALAVLAAGCIGGGEASSNVPDALTAEALARTACDNLDPEILLRTWRGARLDRSGDIQIIPKDPNFVNGGLTHATPFDYTQNVPLFLYGRGYVRPGVYEEPVTLTDVAPTTGALLKFPFDAPDGSAQLQALLPEAERPVPALVVTVIWDSAGDDVLDRWPTSWPYLRSLLPDGAWFTNATVGASPSNTPTGHAEIGTGSFPRRNGFVDEYIRLNGGLRKPNENGPAFLLEPTLADLYDLAMGNLPKVGAVATLAAHIMMMGHGRQWFGGDDDLAVLREKEEAPTAGAESSAWNLPENMGAFYDLPDYANDLPPLATYVDEVDRADGALDGLWRDNDIAQLAEGFNTPARTPYQQTLVEAIIEREGFGADALPDLLYVNYKAIDTIGHLFSADGIEMSDAVATQDIALEGFVAFLNEHVGEGRWVMVLAADHGTQRDPDASGAFMIDLNKLQTHLTATFDDTDDRPLVVRIRPTEIWLNRAELAENGYTLEQVSTWLLRLTQADTFKRADLPEFGHDTDTVFAAALPTSTLSELPCLSPAARAGG